MIHSAEDRLAAYAPGSPVIHGAGAKQQNGRSQEDGPSDDAGRCGCETDEHDAGGQSEGSHSGMQPTTKSRLDRFRDLRQSGVGTGFTGRMPRVGLRRDELLAWRTLQTAMAASRHAGGYDPVASAYGMGSG